MRGEVGERRDCASLLSDAVAQLARAHYPSLCVRTLSPTDLARAATAAALSASHDASFAVRSLSLPAKPAVAPHSTTVPSSSPTPPPSWPAPRSSSGASAPTGFGGNWTMPILWASFIPCPRRSFPPASYHDENRQNELSFLTLTLVLKKMTRVASVLKNKSSR